MAIISNADLGRFRKLMLSYKFTIRSNIKAAKKWASGRTWNTLAPYENVGSNTLEIGLQSPVAAQIQQLETGRKPGRVPRADIFYDWSKQKGLSFPDDKKRWSFSWALRKKIEKSGTLQFSRPRDTSIFSDLYPKYEKKAADLIVNCMKSKFTLILKNNGIRKK